VSARAATDFLDSAFDASAGSAPDRRTLAAAALLYAARRTTARSGAAAELAGFNNCAGLRFPLRLEQHGESVALELEPNGQGAFVVHIGQDRVPADLIELGAHAARMRIDGVLVTVDYAFAAEHGLYLHAGSATHGFDDVTHQSPRDAGRDAVAGSGRAIAPMDGAIVDVPVRAGDAVVRGQTLAVVEAMKLELKVAADRDGVVATVHVTRGTQVKARQLLVELA
jgi:acetyl/propionyl-CoA carboxylase alpha subunit